MNLDHLDELLDAYVFGNLTQEQATQLQEALQADSAARSRFVRSIFIETGLQHLARRGPDAVVLPQQPAPKTRTRRRATPGGNVRLRRLAFAAVVLVAIGAAVFHFARQDPNGPAHLVSGKVLVDGQSGDRIPKGSTLRVMGPAPAVIHLADGSIATLDPGTQLSLHGHVDRTRQVINLAAGGGLFRVPNGGGQFRLDTPVGSITVIGTEFTAVLRSPRALFLSVLTGTVQFVGAGSTCTLKSGQSRTFGPGPDTTRPLPDVDEQVQVMQGYVRKVDLEAGTFVLGGRNETNTPFRFGVKRGEREVNVFLDGKKSSFRNDFPPRSKSSVTYIEVGDALWALKVEITSPEK